MAVMAIALFASMATVSTTYLNPGAVRTVEWQKRFERTFTQLERGYAVYRQAGTTFVREEQLGEDGEVLAYWYTEEFHPAASIENYVVPPHLPMNTNWSFDAALGGEFFCLHGEFFEEPGRAAVQLKHSFGPQYVVGEACGATTSSELSSYSNMAVTYWVRPPQT